MLAIVPKDPSSGSPYEYASADKRLSYTLGLVVEKELVLGGQTHPAGHLTFQPKTTPTATSTPPITEPPPAPPAPGPDLSNLDSDSDGLTASEEVLFQTSPVNPDSDSDGYRDNIEIMNFYSPTDSTGIKLDQAGLVKLSTNQAQNFNFYYPTSWVVSVPDADGKETLITTGTGENFSISVKDNPDSKTSWEWYTQNISHDYNPSSVTIVNIAGHEAIKTLDGLQAYVAAGTKIYVLKYTLNTETVIRYPSVFTFILNYFKIL
jgi:hypothetical protein